MQICITEIRLVFRDMEHEERQTKFFHDGPEF